MGRGGGSDFDAIRALPTGASHDGIRITEQGEVVASKYGDPEIGRASLETIIAASLLAELSPESYDAADGPDGALLAEFSEKWLYRAYRGLVYETPGFEVYFREWRIAAPRKSQISKSASRPASRFEIRPDRGPEGHSVGVQLVRGAGDAAWLVRLRECRGEDRGREAQADLAKPRLPFGTTIANMEMVLAKSSMPIARRYSELLEDRDLAKNGFTHVSKRNGMPPWKAVLTISGQKGLLETDPRLMASIQSRLPYVDALNHLQVDLLRRRRAGDADEETHRGIHMSINGVSAGLRNSG